MFSIHCLITYYSVYIMPHNDSKLLRMAYHPRSWQVTIVTKTTLWSLQQYSPEVGVWLPMWLGNETVPNTALPTFSQGTPYARVYVTLHHKMSCKVPDGHFHVFIFSESKFYAFYIGETHFQIRGLMAELHVFEYGSTTFGTFGKTWFKYWRFLC